MAKATEKSYREARKERLSKEQKNSKKRTPKGVRRKKIKKGIIWGIVIIVLAALITGISLVKTGFVHRRLTAFEVGGEKFTIADYNYWYQMIANEVVNSTYTYPDRETVMTNVFSIIGVAKAAEAKGYKLEGDDLKTYESTVAQLKSDQSSYNGSAKEFFNKYYGFGTNEEIVLKNYRYQLIAIKYYNDFCDKLDYSDEDLNKYYEEFGLETMAQVDFRVAIFSTDAGNTFSSAYGSAEDAKNAANRLDAIITDETSFINAIKSEAQALGCDMTKFDEKETLEEGFIYTNMNSKLSELRDWIFSTDRKANDHAVFTAEIDGKEVTYLIFMVKPAYIEEYKTIDMRHILVKKAEDTTKTDEELKADAKSKIEQICAKWEDTAMTDEDFAKLAKDYSDDTTKDDGGLIEKVQKGQLVEAIETFLFDSERKTGDYKIVESTYGYHLVYYKGTNVEKWIIDAEALLTEKDFEAETKKLCEDAGITMSRSNHAIDLFATEQIDESIYYQ